MKPYSQYKDSGLPWMGQIPDHWKIVPGFSQFTEKYESNRGLKESTVLSLSYGKIVIKPIDKLHGLVPASFETYQIINPEDIIIRPTDLQNDWTSLRVGISKHRGIITSAYICLKTNNTTLPYYGYLILYVYDLLKVFYGMGSGLRQNLTFKDLKRMLVIVPPQNEQQKIIDFVLSVDNIINRYIRAKQRQIELLKEQKQAIISRAMTKGLDQTVKMKPSGVEWLGEIPEHWEVKKLKNLTRNIKQQSSTKLSDEAYVALEHIESWTGKVNPLWGNVNFESQVKRFHVDDILFGKLRPYLAKVTRPVFFGVCVSELLVLRVKTEEVLSQYIEIMLRSKPLIDLINSSTFGAKMPRAEWSFIGNVFIPYPIHIEEQKNIVESTITRTVILDSTVVQLQKEIEMMIEYRIRLISDVVTGKLDVRNVNIPDINIVEQDELIVDDVGSTIDPFNEIAEEN